jgi:hypothetical protein
MINVKKCKFNKEQKEDIKLGTKIEMEHTKSKQEAKIIAGQHECEFSKTGNLYYKDGLIPMEKKLKQEKENYLGGLDW